MQQLKNKVAVITGGNSGIGKGIAQSFLEEGAKVVIFGRDAGLLQSAAAELGGNVYAVQGDVTITADLQRLYAETVAHYGTCDIVVANAGVGERLHATETTEKHFDYLVDINYRGLFFTVRYALEHLNSNASVILISSCAASVTIPRHSVYASTKAAVVKLAQNLAYDLAAQSIRVNSISPGYIKTPIFDARLKVDPDYLNKRAKQVPLQRIGTPKDVGNAAVFLASEASSYITGVDLLVDGGYSASFGEPS